VEFLLLGPLEVRDEGRTVALPRAKQRALLAVLLLNANEVVSTDRLIDALWGESPPKTAVESLHNLVSQLRRVVGDTLVTRPPGYVLQVEPWRIDLERFQALVAEADRAPAPARAAKLREALALWRGPALADLAFEPFAEHEAGRLDELRASAGEELAEAELSLGRNADVVPELEALVAAHPLRERLRAQLMLALYRSGRQAEALDAYRDARRALRDGLGLEPSPALRELERAILRQDPRLARRPVSAEEPAAVERRRVVTVVAAMADAEDPEAIAGTFAPFRAAVERHGGSVETVAGDEALAVFGARRTREDDALRAARAADEARAADLQIGLDTGEVVSSALVGGVVTSARALARAGAGVAIGDRALALVRDAVDVEGHVLLAVRDAPAPARRLDAPFVGRGRELATLLDAFSSARDGVECRSVTVIGDAGIGKTRLARELASHVDATVLVGRCVSYGEGATYLPLSEALPVDDSVLAGEEDAETIALRVGQLLGRAEGAAPTGEAHWAVRRYLEALARRHPLVLVVEDIHWAEPALLDLLEYVARWSSGAPILLLSLARPDLLDARPGWGTPPAPGTRLTLAPLPEEDARAAVAALPRADELGEQVQERVVELAEGNPLYAEQLLAFAAEGGELAGAPPTVDALIAARLDRLGADEREVLERAAVIGREFDPAAVASLGNDPTQAFWTLRARGLVDENHFHHMLVRDVAYSGITKGRRAELHERAAGWLERHDGPNELVGYHLEQAARYVREHRGDEGHARRLAADAGDRLGSAGMRAWHREDAAATANLLERASKLLGPDDPRRRELLCELALADRTIGRLDAAEKALTYAVEASSAAGDRRIELRARIELEAVRLLSDRGGDPERLLSQVEAAIPLFEVLGDDRALGRAWLVAGYAEGGFRCRNAAWAVAAERAVDHYRRAGWSPSTCVGELSGALYHGPATVTEALERSEKLLADAEDRSSRANVAALMGAMLAESGRNAEGRALAEDARRTYEELGHTIRIATRYALASAEIHLLAGEADAAAAELREACALLQERGEWAHLANQAAGLAEALALVGEEADAMRWSEISERHAAPHDVWAQFAWRRARAAALTAAGRPDEAEEVARAALDIVGATDAVNDHAATLVVLASALEARGDEAGAEATRADAVALYKRKGNVAAAERVRAHDGKPRVGLPVRRRGGGH
jgi:DNA-binding SARP family transcriptional activator/predicted ATPase